MEHGRRRMAERRKGAHRYVEGREGQPRPHERDEARREAAAEHARHVAEHGVRRGDVDGLSEFLTPWVGSITSLIPTSHRFVLNVLPEPRCSV